MGKKLKKDLIEENKKLSEENEILKTEKETLKVTIASLEKDLSWCCQNYSIAIESHKKELEFSEENNSANIARWFKENKEHSVLKQDFLILKAKYELLYELIKGQLR
jgi:hypothetical protein